MFSWRAARLKYCFRAITIGSCGDGGTNLRDKRNRCFSEGDGTVSLDLSLPMNLCFQCLWRKNFFPGTYMFNSYTPPNLFLVGLFLSQAWLLAPWERGLYLFFSSPPLCASSPNSLCAVTSLTQGEKIGTHPSDPGYTFPLLLFQAFFNIIQNIQLIQRVQKG